MTQIIEVGHSDPVSGREYLRGLDLKELGIPSFAPTLDTRWRAEFKGRFLDPGENEQVIMEVLRIIGGLRDITTQRAIYYAIRGAHPDWKYKGGPLGDEFYAHMIQWVMEKIQLMTGRTMQSLGVWAAPRGYIAGDGTITSRRGRISLTARPALGFDLADEGVSFNTNAGKVIHFEKDAGLEAFTSGDFPKYVEAIFSTSQGQLTEAANKFLRKAETEGMNLYAVHDGDPSGIQMQLMHGMSSKNSAYMPAEFYPRLVKPLGFYPSIGMELGLPPEPVTTKEDGIFNNLVALATEKTKMFPQLRRFGFAQELKVIVGQRRKWEFQALNAMHEAAPKIYLVEALRVHNDDVKHVPPADDVKGAVLEVARDLAQEEVEDSIRKLAKSVYETQIEEELVKQLRAKLAPQIADFTSQVDRSLRSLEATPATNFREEIKSRLVRKPALYALDAMKKLAQELLPSTFEPAAEVSVAFEVDAASATVKVIPYIPPSRTPITKTELVDAIHRYLIPGRTRDKIVSKIRTVLEERFGKANEEW